MHAHVSHLKMARLGPVSVLHVTGKCLAVRDGENEGEAIFTFERAVEVYNVSHSSYKKKFR